jgi:hypothetical protein
LKEDPILIPGQPEIEKKVNTRDFKHAQVLFVGFEEACSYKSSFIVVWMVKETS